MPVTLSADEFAQRYGAQDAAPMTLSADEFNSKYGSVAAQIAYRKEHPPATAHGDPNVQPDIGVGGAVVKGIAHLVGAPTSMAEVPGAMKDAALNAATMGMYGTTKMEGQAVSDVAHGNVPIVGQSLTALAKPAQAYMHSNAPTVEENRGAITAGTELAGMAAMQHPAVGALIGKVGGRAGAAAVESGTQTYADALGSKTAANRPLQESLASQLAGEGEVLRNPKTDLGPAMGGTTDVTIKKFGTTTAARDAQLEALTKKYKDAEITDTGTDYIVRHRSPERIQADTMAEGMTTPKAPRPSGITGLGRRGTIGAVVGGGIGALFGHPILGAELGIGAVEAASKVKQMVQSPLWKTTSGVVKTSLGRAMQAQDFGTVAAIAGRVLAGQNLEDAYGHDSALFNLFQSIPKDEQNDPVKLHQALQEYTAVVVQPDGTAIEVPHHVLKQTKDALSSHR